MNLSSRFWATVLVFGVSMPAFADDFERAPILYSQARPENAVSRLQARLESGKVNLSYEGGHGYLPALLKALGVPESTQTLVFSKTSLQRSRITPRTPRALYFNDEVYVGFCRDGPVLEISAVDPQLGAVFYTLEQEEVARPKFVRQTDACLLCHGSSHTKHVPGHTLRSLYADADGEAILSLGSFRIDQTTPFEKRWGGWYVTGTHGKQTHLGNLVVKNPHVREPITHHPEGQNVTSLKQFVDTSAYLSPHSDIVALLVLEHQAEAQNLLARANFQTRIALHEQELLSKELGQSYDFGAESTRRRIKSVADPLVRYLLFSKEAPLTGKIQGTSTFAADFAAQGPRDRKGRSLRDFDLETRLFKHPCSYLIYSEPFAQLPGAVKDYVYQALYDVLSGRENGAAFAHLGSAERQAILEILRDTKSDLPDYWRK